MQDEIIHFVSYHPVLVAGWIGLFIAVLYLIYKEYTLKGHIITYNQAIFLINRKDAYIIDIRHIDSFHKGHIAGSINVLPEEIKSNSIDKLCIHKNKPIIVVDYINNMKTQDLVNTLSKVGFEKIFILKDGISGWNRENLPLIRK